jgi:hypothetical protein
MSKRPTTIYLSIYGVDLKKVVDPSKRYIQIRPKKDVYKYSFFPHTIRDWNQLSDELLDIESSEEFKSRLTKLYYGG